MTRVAFLLDENIPAAVARALRQAEPLMTVRYAGHDPDCPPKKTPDPQLLIFAEENGYALVTFDINTMPGHVVDHLAGGRHTRGVFIFPTGNSLSAGRVAQELLTVWGASVADEWIDRIEFLPY
jgi:hypothetical protein